MSLSFYNTLHHAVEPFESVEKGKVSVYHCGPTVYKRQHLGNLRRFLFADFLRRTLELHGYEVREITNITDVGHLTEDDLDTGDDKLARAAQEHKTTPQTIAERETKHFFQDIDDLGIQRSHHYPHATEHIQEMQDLIKLLLDRDHAYITESGVYFDVTTFAQYGALSGNTVESLAAGARIAVRGDKRNPADFALWVFDDKALQQWDSPWGVGYPGWHIECSAMSLAYLSAPLDIHTGGEDNIFPHHENEIAQSEAATGKPFARFWLHNRHLLLSGTKLAKRTGEQLTLDTVRERGLSPLAFRLFIFSSHYRTPLDFSWEAVAAADENLTSFSSLLRRLHELLPAGDFLQAGPADTAFTDRFHEALGDDLGTPAALAVVMEYVTHVNTLLDKSGVSAEELAQIGSTLHFFDRVLGVFVLLLHDIVNTSMPTAVQDLLEQREAARARGDFAAADALRVQIEEHGFTVEDTPHGARLIPTKKSK